MGQRYGFCLLLICCCYSINEMVSLMVVYLQITSQLKSLQIVGSLIAERDGEIRKAALNTLATGYKILGMK